MNGAITNRDALKSWFFDNAKPYFTLRYYDQDRVIMRNDNQDDMQKAWEMLERHVIGQADSGQARLILFVYDKGKHNNATYTNIDMHPRYSAQPSIPAAISGLPAGVGSIEELVNERVRVAMLEKENQDLKEQLSAPQNGWERSLETISGVPGMADVFKIIAAGLVSKFSPQSMPVVQGILNGTPDAMTGADHDEDDGADPGARFTSNIQETAATLNVDPLTLSEKLRALVKTHPDIARQFLQQ